MLASRKPDGTSLYYLVPADQFLFSSSENLPEEVIPLSHRIAIPNFDLHFGCQWDNALEPCTKTAAALASVVRNVVELQYYPS